MRLIVVSCVLVVAGCASNPVDDTAAVARACSVAGCFNERDIRDFEVVDRTTLIVYTGAQRCPFRVELRGTFCDMTFAPQLYFSKINEAPNGPIEGSNSAGPNTDPFGLTEAHETRDTRVCSNDLQINVHGGQFTESASTNQPTDRYGNVVTDCRVMSVESMTDDQLIEFYVARELVPPPPPVGSGEIEVGEQPEEEGSATGEPASPTAQTNPEPSPAEGSVNAN